MEDTGGDYTTNEEQKINPTIAINNNNKTRAIDSPRDEPVPEKPTITAGRQEIQQNKQNVYNESGGGGLQSEPQLPQINRDKVYK